MAPEWRSLVLAVIRQAWERRQEIKEWREYLQAVTRPQPGYTGRVQGGESIPQAVRLQERMEHDLELSTAARCLEILNGLFPHFDKDTRRWLQVYQQGGDEGVEAAGLDRRQAWRIKRWVSQKVGERLFPAYCGFDEIREQYI